MCKGREWLRGYSLVILAARSGAAIERGVLFSLSFNKISAPCSISIRATSPRSLWAAQCRGAKGLTKKLSTIHTHITEATPTNILLATLEVYGCVVLQKSLHELQMSASSSQEERDDTCTHSVQCTCSGLLGYIWFVASVLYTCMYIIHLYYYTHVFHVQQLIWPLMVHACTCTRYGRVWHSNYSNMYASCSTYMSCL